MTSRCLSIGSILDSGRVGSARYQTLCKLDAKCEFLNPGGSVKDRVAYQMIQEAQANGHIHPGTRLVEPTSGNFGIGIALSSAVLGYHATLVIQDNKSNDKIFTEYVLGGEVIETSSTAKHGDKDDFVSVAADIVKSDPNAYCLDQFINEINWKTHYEQTAGEILAALNKVDMMVMGVGTGGTLTGVGRRVKETFKNCKVIAVDPLGSTIFNPNGKYKPSLVEGIGGDYAPKVLDKSVADYVVRPNDNESFNMAREVIKKEGILCGGSSGAALFAAIQAARHYGLEAGSKVVVIFPDSIRNYMNKFVCDQWMEAHIFMNPPHRSYKWWCDPICHIPIKTVPKLTEDMTVLDAMNVMLTENSSIVIVINNDGEFVGAVTKDSLRKEITSPNCYNGGLKVDNLLKNCLMKECLTICGSDNTSTIGRLSRMLDITPFVVVIHKIYDTNNIPTPKVTCYPSGVITAEMVWDFIELYLRQ